MKTATTVAGIGAYVSNPTGETTTGDLDKFLELNGVTNARNFTDV